MTQDGGRRRVVESVPSDGVGGVLDGDLQHLLGNGQQQAGACFLFLLRQVLLELEGRWAEEVRQGLLKGRRQPLLLLRAFPLRLLVGPAHLCRETGFPFLGQTLPDLGLEHPVGPAPFVQGDGPGVVLVPVEHAHGRDHRKRHRMGGGEDGLHPEIVFLADGIELVVVAAGAGQGQTHEGRSRHVDPIGQTFVAELGGVQGGLADGGSKPV